MVMKSFSQRKGYKLVSEVIQIKSMNEELRNSLWNVLDLSLWSSEGYLSNPYDSAEIEPFSESLWLRFFKEPIDTIPGNNKRILKSIRKFFFGCEWYEVYDFLEFVSEYQKDNLELTKAINAVLEREFAGYRLISGNVVDITDEQEVQMLQEALQDTRFEGVNCHLQRALELLSNKGNPDYRNSIKESISAVESMAKIITGDSKATLGEALKCLERSNKIHAALKKGFSSLYGYASNEGGIRHAMLEQPNLTIADAKFFLLSCTSFANYLKSQL